MVNLRIQLPDGFLDEEERCDYLISKQMKQVWAVELDLLYEFQRVVDKHGIKYIANGGTMLGAVRHHGFIPWDDDVDLMMMREEYDKLCKVAEQEFHYPYFFQTEYTDSGCMHCHAQLRRSDTTAMLKTQMAGNLTFNQGIFIDIFPLDAVPDDNKEWEKECKIAQHYYERKCCYANLSSLFLPNPLSLKYLIKKFLHVWGSPLFAWLARKYFEKYEKECKKYNHLPTEKLSLYCWGYKYKQMHLTRADYEEMLMMEFEFLKVPVCKNYDHSLTEQFGDWHQLVRGGSQHGGVLFDTERPYTYYLKA